MNGQRIFDLWHSGLVTAAWVAAPFLLVALGVGFITSLLQAATQLQENAISFVPKIVAAALVLVLAGPWLLSHLTQFTSTSMTTLVDLGREAGTK